MEPLNLHDAYTFLMSVSFARRANFTSQREGELFLSLSLCRRLSETNLHSFQAASLLKENESLREEVCLMGLLFSSKLLLLSSFSSWISHVY